jgi:hypothetical protein
MVEDALKIPLLLSLVNVTLPTLPVAGPLPMIVKEPASTVILPA